MKKLTKKQEFIVNLIQERGLASTQEILKRFTNTFDTISRQTLIRILNNLIEERWLIREGKGRGIHYRTLLATPLLSYIDPEKYFKIPPDERKTLTSHFNWDVFEHFVNPLTAIEKINRSLIPGGYVAMLLPMYISSWTFRVFIALRPILKKLNLPQNFKVLLKLETKDSSFNPPYHVYEYSRKTVRRLLENSGFKVLAIKGNLPIPESLAHAQGGESLTRMVLRQAALWVYKMIKFSTENFNFPLVRSLVIAQKIEKSK